MGPMDPLDGSQGPILGTLGTPGSIRSPPGCDCQLAIRRLASWRATSWPATLLGWPASVTMPPSAGMSPTACAYALGACQTC